MIKLEFLTQDDPIYVLPFFEEFFRHYASEFSVERVFASRVMGKRPRKQMFKELLSLYRPIGFSKLCSRLAAYKCLGTLPKRASSRHFYSLKQLCAAYGVAYQQAGNPNDASFVAEMKTRNPDVLVSVACPYILKEALLSVPPLGCVNIHHAPLPRYKGMMPTFWQMFHGETQAGVTVHYMAAKVDEGDALLQSAVQIRPGETLDSLIRRSKRHGAHCMAQALRDIAAGKQQRFKLDQAQGSYFTFPKIEEIQEFHRKGVKAI